MTDFTAQLLSLDRVLMRELNHRINNEFAAVIGSISLAAARSINKDVKAALTAVTELLQHYAYVHRALQIPEHDTLADAAAYLRQLCLSISQSHLAHRKIKLVLAIEPLQLQAEQCWRLGMIVYELIINAARHAFQRGEGEIRVELIRTGTVAECSVMDSGSAPARIEPGRGLKIIDELTRSLGARFERKLGPRGSSSTLIFPSADSSTEGVEERTAQILEEMPTADECVREVGCGARWLIRLRLLQDHRHGHRSLCFEISLHVLRARRIHCVSRRFSHLGHAG